jgi:hypothetical protein
VQKIPKMCRNGGFFKRQRMGTKRQKRGQKTLDKDLQKCYNSLEFGEKDKKVK